MMRENVTPEDAYKKGYAMGLETAVDMARIGHLRIAALPFERGKQPYTRPIRPWKITRLAWRSWWRESRFHGDS